MHCNQCSGIRILRFFPDLKKNTTFMFFEMTHQKVVKVLEFEKLQDVIGA